MTKAEEEAIALIRRDGYAVLNPAKFLGNPLWATAVVDPKFSYKRTTQELNTRVMNRLMNTGRIRLAPGGGYGSNSFWEIVEDDQ